jgi:putative flippase GtrA
MQTFAQIITKIVDFFYRPFRKYIPQQLFRYAACGGGNMVLDWVLYFILYNFVVGHDLVYISLPFSSQWSLVSGQVCLTPHILTLLIVFPITLLTGFWLNKYVTFTQSSLRGYKQLWRYILIVAVNLLVNYLGLKLLVEVCGIYPTPSKMIVTIITVVISFFGQKYFSFRS